MCTIFSTLQCSFESTCNLTLHLSFDIICKLQSRIARKIYITCLIDTQQLARLILPRKLSCFYLFSIFQERLQAANQINISTSALEQLSWERINFLGISNAESMRNLNWQVDQVGVFLDLAGDAHVDVLVANGDDHAADDRWIDLCCEMNGLV